MVHGIRGVGKTNFLLGAAYAIATGGKFLYWSAPKARQVLYIDGEMGAASMQERIKGLGTPPENLRILSMTQQKRGLNLSSRIEQGEIEPFLADIEVVIVDNISCLCRGGKENDADSWDNTQTWILQQRQKGRSILLVHHSGKTGKQRGTSHREDVLNSVLQLRYPPDYVEDEGCRFEVHFEKHRDFAGRAASPFEASLSRATGTWSTCRIKPSSKAEDKASKFNKSKIADLLDQGLSIREIGEKMSISKSAVARYAKQRYQGKDASGASQDFDDMMNAAFGEGAEDA